MKPMCARSRNAPVSCPGGLEGETLGSSLARAPEQGALSGVSRKAHQRTSVPGATVPQGVRINPPEIGCSNINKTAGFQGLLFCVK